MTLFRLLFYLSLIIFVGCEEDDVTVEFSSHMLDRPIENAKNASIVTADEIEIRIPYNRNSASLGEGSNTSDVTLNSTSDSTESVNATGNITDAKAKIKVDCNLRTLAEDEVLSVQLANSSVLLQVLGPVANKSATTGDCVVVLFYSNQCVFSARMAPHFNALPRVFPHISFYAVDVLETGNLYMRYGLIYVPNVMLFHNSKPVARYNETILSLDFFVKFINKFTGMEYNGTLNVTSMDMLGPVPSTIVKQVDYVLLLAWVFTLCCLCFGFTRTPLCKKTVDFFRNTWHEANAAQHEHED